MKNIIHILIITFLFGGIIFCGEDEARANWYDGSWTYRKAITIQSSEVETTETSFPVLVSVTDPDLKSTGSGGHVSQANGYDIIFTDDDGTSLLDFEIESWDSLTGEIQAWVETDVSATEDKVIYIYYGNASAIDLSNMEGVWDSNFVMVQHLQEDPSTGAPQMIDSTSNSNDGTSNGTMTSGDQVAGQVDGSVDFDGVDDNVNLGSITSGNPLMLNGSDVTISAWISKLSGGDGWQRIVDKSTSVNGTNGYALWINGKIIGIAVNGISWDTDADAMSYSTLHHIVAVITSNSWKVYVDGVEKSGAFYTGGAVLPPNATANMRIGTWNHSTVREFGGMIDEVRISNTARSADWITTEYNNQNSPATFLIFGSEERDVYYLMQSANYKIEKDSINFGGTDGSGSDNYLLNDTMGEIGTGDLESDAYQMGAGYRQMDEEEILSFSIRNSGETADTNSCALGTLSTSSVSTCSYRLKIGSTASAGFQVGFWADDQLNQSTASIDIDDITENFTVAAGIEGHGITVAPPTDNGIMGTATTWTEQSPFDDDDTPIPAGEALMDVIFASNGTQDIDLNGTGDLDGTALITHRAAISTATREGSYNQVVTYIVSSVL